MREPLSRNWQYIDTQVSGLVDPRLVITKHLDWTMTSCPDTTWTGCEPDNYNFAIYDTKPHDLMFIQHQCFYYLDKTINTRKYKGWMSLYVAEEKLHAVLFNREILKLQPQAVWRYATAKPIRPRRPLLNRENNYSNRSTFTTEERLFQQGYYEKFKSKYFDDEKLLKVVGTPRGAVLDYQPEVDSYDDSNYLEES
jgi:hypothetical protein